MFTLNYRVRGACKQYHLPEGETRVGRLGTRDLVIDDDIVSRRHAVFRIGRDGCTVRDDGSTNGTFLNDQRVTGEASVSSGDRVTLARLELHVTEWDDQAPVADPPGPHTIFLSATVPIGETSAPARELLALLSGIGTTLVTVDRLSDILERIVELVFQFVDAERCALLLRDDENAAPAARVVKRRPGILRPASFSQSIVKRVMDQRVAMLSPDARNEPGVDPNHSVRVQDIRSFMCAPLWNRQAVIGVLHVDTSVAGRFSKADLELFTALSNYAAVAIERARLTERVEQERRLRERLERYFAVAVVDRILKSGRQEFIAEEREVSVLFADIVGFTTISEGFPLTELAAWLNRYLATMSDAVFAEEGTLVKFAGDGVLAVFGAPLDQPDHALRAVRAALDIRRRLVEIGREVDKVLESSIRIRIAIHSGPVMTGDVGSPRRCDYTVLGDTVNVAARLQTDVAEPGQIIVTEATYKALKDKVGARPLIAVVPRGRKEVTVRGRDEAIVVYIVDDRADEA